MVTPLTQGDDANFKKLASLIGINVEKIIDLPNSTEINWVEKTLTNNSLINGARLALEEGVKPPIYISGNVEGGREHNITLENLFMGRVKHL